MSRLSLDQISRENPNQEVISVTSLHLSHRALSDVSCLASYHNLEKLDLNFNCLSSLESLSSCVNLKWLSVVENKLETLKGIQSLTKLMVFNAGKNKLQKMDEISSIVSLRAVILNDNTITSICKLDRLKYLNTLVLSRNPICEIGDSLMNAKSLTKLSLSHCQLQAIGSSLTSCVDLKEARLAHNKLISVPTELAQNIRLQNLDMGNNLIQDWSDLKVLSALRNLKNLNLQGNPIAEKSKLAKRVKNLVPNLRVFNSKPIEGSNRRETTYIEDTLYPIKGNPPLENASNFEGEKEVQRKKSKIDIKASGREVTKRSIGEVHGLPSSDKAEVGKQTKRKKSKTVVGVPMESVTGQREDDFDTKDAISLGTAKTSRSRKSEKKGGTMCEDIDIAEATLLDQNLSDEVFQDLRREKKIHNVVPDASLRGIKVIEHVKKKEKVRDKDAGLPVLQLLSSNSEVGLGGPSMWDD